MSKCMLIPNVSNLKSREVGSANKRYQYKKTNKIVEEYINLLIIYLHIYSLLVTVLNTRFFLSYKDITKYL